MAILCKVDDSGEEDLVNNFVKSCYYVIFGKNVSSDTSLVEPILILKRIVTRSILMNDHLVESPAYNDLDSSHQNNARNEQEFKTSFVKNVFLLF